MLSVAFLQCVLCYNQLYRCIFEIGMLTFFGTEGKRKKASNYTIVFNFIAENLRLEPTLAVACDNIR